MPPFAYFAHERDVRVFKAGDVIFADGDPGHHMFAVLEGDVEIRKGERVLERLTIGGIFGELALIDRTARSATAIAVRDCRLAAVGQQWTGKRRVDDQPRCGLVLDGDER